MSFYICGRYQTFTDLADTGRDERAHQSPATQTPKSWNPRPRQGPAWRDDGLPRARRVAYGRPHYFGVRRIAPLVHAVPLEGPAHIPGMPRDLAARSGIRRGVQGARDHRPRRVIKRALFPQWPVSDLLRL